MAASATTEAAPKHGRIFNHDIMGCTAEGVTGNQLYSGRVLGMTEPGDVIQLHPDLRPQWPCTRDHYRRVGLSHTENLIWSVDQTAMTERPDHEVSVFFFGSGEREARPDQAWFRAVDFINSKNNFMALADVDLSGIEYDFRSKAGVILVNRGPILVGKLLFLIAGTPRIQERLVLEPQQRL